MNEKVGCLLPGSCKEPWAAAMNALPCPSVPGTENRCAEGTGEEKLAGWDFQEMRLWRGTDR
jgi:hypothetical protein